MPVINGVDIDKAKETKTQLEEDPSLADRNPTISAKWQGSGSLTTIQYEDKTVQIGGDTNLNAMQTLLAALAACDVDLVVTHASLLGIKLDKLSIEATGHFNSRAYYGVEDSPGPGYDRIDYVVNIKAPGITPVQVEKLKDVCEKASPVGDSLTRKIPLSITFNMK